ncbi:hypothetical protein [Aliidiomarina sanyensis]|uniref:Uncharacterized protein n=1 Tax=Aliidiomarina sanyensis TaxID=1249555 RepID=A0A432WAX7_9GAMM|nr:hypothetical protein [Aliidiomarina sanyensis]RUO27862.1 hypothetical protein CWE11_11180 [Aliidiomarina sanyensis]
MTVFALGQSDVDSRSCFFYQDNELFERFLDDVPRERLEHTRTGILYDVPSQIWRLGTERSLVDEVIELVKRMDEELEDDSISIDEVLRALQILYEMLQKKPFSTFRIPELGVDRDGEISSTWMRGDGASFSISVSSEGRVSYAAYDPEGSKYFGIGKNTDDYSFMEATLRAFA